MNQLHPSGPLKGLLFNDHPLPLFPHRRDFAFLINALVPQADKPMAVPWLLERRVIKAVLTSNQPGFNAVNRGGDHD